MSQYLSQIPSQQLRQEQRLTPQLIQSMNILQLNVAALENHIQEELEQNPLLEYEPETGAEQETSAAPAGDEAPATESNGFDVLDWLSEHYDFDGGDRSPGLRVQAGERDAKLDAMANTPSRQATLYEYLHDQWVLVDAPEEVKRAGEALINYIEDDGYLRSPLEMIASSTRPPLSTEALEEALVRVQSLEPAGVGARDLKECLLLQLAALPGDNSLEVRLITEHFEDMVKNRLPQVARAVGCDIEEIKEVMSVIARLTPSPGLNVADRNVPRIKPDVIVDYSPDGKGYAVRLARGNEPRLRIARKYLHMIRDRGSDKAARDYLNKHYESAKALIDAIGFRRSRLLEVAEAVVERQKEFFDQGQQALKTLRMSELAEEFGCDPSTISRTVADKYLQSPRGIYPLRDFFGGGTENREGESTSWDSVKARVAELVDGEDKKQPYSDDQVAAILEKEGIDISRRTIAKYRQQLGIPTARQRKTF